VKAQTVVNFYDQLENSIIVKFDSNQKINKPEKIVLVFGDDVCTFKETNELDSYKTLNQGNNFEPDLTPASFKSLLAVDTEQEMEIEDWMLKPFTPEYAYDFLVPDEEEDIKLEDWMLDLSKWD
jgi:hypothetical protein